MASIVMNKANVVDDAVPVGSPAGRVFSVPAFIAGSQTGIVFVQVEILTAADVTVADGTYSISLWLYLGGVWTKITPKLTSIARGEKIALPFGDLTQDTIGYFQLESITGTAANHVTISADLAQAEVKGRTNQLGYPYVEAVGAGGAAAATEATQLLVEGHVSTIDTNLGSVVGAPDAALPSNATSVGGIGKDTAPTAVTDSRGVRAWFSRVGSLFTRLTGPDNADLFPSAAAPADGVTNAENTPSLRARLIGFNGTTWDRIKSGVTGAQTAATGLLNNLGFVKYNATRPVLLDTYLTELQATPRGDLAVSEQNRPQSQDDTNRVVWVMPRVLGAATTLEPTAGAWTVVGNVGASGGLALAASWVCKAAPGVFGKVEMRLDATAPSATYYFHVINASSLPVDGAVTHLIPPRKIVHNVGFDDPIEYDAAPQWIWASTGIVVYLSTTEFAKTLAGAYLSGAVFIG